jgi:hypothetical protein
MDETDEIPPIELCTDVEVRELLGLFDVPAFARRGQDMRYTLERLALNCRRQREAMLEWVRLRLRQWAGTVPGFAAWPACFAEPIDELAALVGARDLRWSSQPTSLRRQRAAAKALVASLERFNRRWTKFVAELDLSYINTIIEQYNHYYVFEKECCLGSARLAARHFVPQSRISVESLLAEYPTLPVPALVF